MGGGCVLGVGREKERFYKLVTMDTDAESLNKLQNHANTHIYPLTLPPTSLLVANFSQAVTHSSMVSTLISSGMSVCFRKEHNRGHGNERRKVQSVFDQCSINVQ